MAHLRDSSSYHMPNKRLRFIDCAPIFAHSRVQVLGAQLDQSASGRQRLHADYTGALGWSTCTGTTEGMCHVSPECASCGVLRGAPAPRAASCEALQAPPARGSSVFGPSRPPCARYGALGWPARCAQPRLDGFDGSLPLHPAREAAGELWSAPPET
jgi:hypothetical protein